MPIKYEFEVNWGRDYSSSMIWRKVCEVLGATSLKFTEEYTGAVSTYDEVFKLLEVNDSDFFYRADYLSVSLISSPEKKLDRMLVMPEQEGSKNLIEKFSLIASSGFCRWGRVFDSEYNDIQNIKDIRRLKSKGIDFSSWAVKDNGLPPPLRQDAIDISKNPGRNILRENRIEAVGSVMWLSDEWCAHMGVNYVDFTCIAASSAGAGVLLEFYDRCFDSWGGEQRLAQDRIWSEIYGQ